MPPSGVDFLHRLRSDPKSHHITIGPAPVQFHSPRDPNAPSQSQPSPSPHTTPESDEHTPELEVDDPRELYDDSPDPLPEPAQHDGSHPSTPTDDDDPAVAFQTRGHFLDSNRGDSSASPFGGALPGSPKTRVVSVAPDAPSPRRVHPQRPNGAPKRSQSDFGKTQTLGSDEIPPADSERSRRIAADGLPPQLSLGANGKADWQCFCVAYAAGMWNPNYTPQPPQGPSGRFSTDVLRPAPHSHSRHPAPPNDSDLRSPTSTNAPPVPLDMQWAAFQQPDSAAVGSLPSEGFYGRNSVANPAKVVFSLPHPEREHVDPFGPTQQPPPRKLSEGLPHTGAMLPAMQAEGGIPRKIDEEKVADDDTVIDTFVQMTLGPREERSTASVAEMDTTDDEEDGRPVFEPPTVDPMEEFRSMPQYAHFIEDFPTITHPTEMAIFYRRFGFLPAPMGPRELDRRKALYNFNILHTAKDANFDRITHICKLMFNTKMVVMSLLDSDTSWYKSTSGLELSQSARVTGFCSHTILGNTDEPMVVLDSLKDWRFARNPHVIAAPNIRFFAGAPLRTSDGHNLGALCLIDDKPWDDFPPRSRLILKELAMVVMRELELWRDKVSSFPSLTSSLGKPS
ncbi:two-component sensor molecule [Trichosporon asahii var. asahii CBS 8904]|uniref:Two-component sensor molecule n=1 Tax=Trichosporon asahii var. asahii (strain CBS 8904) TaxID=1220162 RepID=K1V9K2_TRIAC|nr:two-component sensor molecule [Trichosporon asahii var. asahii CBS 8904]